MQAVAKLSFETHEVDGASGNDKLHFYVAKEDTLDLAIAAIGDRSLCKHNAGECNS